MPKTATQPPFNQEDLPEMVTDFLYNAKTLKDVRGMTTDNLEAVYNLAYTAYNSGRYDQAQKMFRFLCFLDHLEKKYWVGLGACMQFTKQYNTAVDAFSMAGLLDPDDPRAPLQAAQCHMALGNREAALDGLKAAIAGAGDDPRHQAIKDKAQAMQSLLMEQSAQ